LIHGALFRCDCLSVSEPDPAGVLFSHRQATTQESRNVGRDMVIGLLFVGGAASHEISARGKLRVHLGGFIRRRTRTGRAIMWASLLMLATLLVMFGREFISAHPFVGCATP
jgi:hypothetical protein